MSIKPLNYYLGYDVNLDLFSFTGKEVIKLSVENEISEIVLNSMDLVIITCAIQNAPIKVKSYSVHKENGLLTIHLEENLKPGEYDLYIEFTGEIRESLAGFYRTKYVQNGQEKYFATTQFEAADARRAFPCFDAPEYKATFDIHFKVDRHLHVVSNTLPYDVVDDGEKKTYFFEKTPLMSTYLVYFGIGEFEFLEDQYKECKLRVVTTPGKSEAGQMALDFTKQFLQYFEEYFDYPYILPKLDLIAVPDFAAGAMENWGAITFRENLLLVYPGMTAQTTIMRIAEVVAHELAHQWFGNLVTMKWWDNLWLNESFATFMAYKAMHQFYPEWDVWSEYMTTRVFGGMDLDSLTSSHPIKLTVNTEAEIDETFDAIAYNKGGSILRMLENFIGEESFRSGLRNYIKAYEYQNTVETDLWSQLEVASSKPVKEIMMNQIQLTGFPVIRADNDGENLILTQERFLLKGNDTDQSVWHVPMTITANGNEYHILMNERTQTLQLNDVSILNNQYSGFYITHYSKELEDKIVSRWGGLTAMDRLGVVHDAYMLTYRGDRTLSDFIQLCKSIYQKEDDPMVLHMILANLHSFSRMCPTDELTRLVTEVSLWGLKKTGLEPNSSDELPAAEMLRVRALLLLMMHDNTEIRTFLKEKNSQMMNNEEVPAGLRGVLFAYAVWSDDKNFDVIWDLYKNAESLEDKIKMLRGLCFGRSESTIKKLLSHMLDGEIRYSNLLYIFGGISENPHAKTLILEWLLASWDDMKESAGGMGISIMRRGLQYIIPVFGIGQSERIKAYFETKDMTGLTMTLAQILEELEINERFVYRNN